MTPMPIVTPIIIPSGGGGPGSPAEGLIIGLVVLSTVLGLTLSIIGMFTDRERLVNTGFGIGIGSILLCLAGISIAMIVQFFLS